MITEVSRPEETDPGDSVFAWIGDRVGLGARTVEWAIGVALALVAMALIAYMARDLWFLGDAWEFLANRTAFDVDSLVRPYGGHWTTWSTLLLRGLYNLVGVDFWPWFYIPRLIGHTLLVIFIWRVMRRRGADPLVGIVAYAILLVLGASGYQRALQVGNWAVYAALIASALIISRRPDEPTAGDRLAVGAALLVAVLGNGYAVAAIGGITISLLLTRRIVTWLPSLVPPVAAYGAWWLTYRDEIRPKPNFTLGNILDIPSGAFGVLRRAVESATALPQGPAGVVVIALLAWVVSLIVRRRLDLFDAMILWTLAIGLSLLTVQRIAIDPSAAGRLRYGYSVSILAILALVPHIRPPRTTLSRGLVVLVGLAMLVANVDQLRIAINVREEISQQDRVLSVEAARMVTAGEPVVAGPSVVARGLESDELVHLVDDGYVPDALPVDQPDRERIEAEARGALRINLIDRQRPRDGYEAPAGESVLTDAPVDAGGCIRLEEGEPVAGTVNDAGLLVFSKTRPQSLLLVWTDEHGEGRRRFDDPHVRAAAVELADPDTTAELMLESSVDSLKVCGFAAA